MVILEQVWENAEMAPFSFDERCVLNAQRRIASFRSGPEEGGVSSDSSKLPGAKRMLRHGLGGSKIPR